MLARRPHLPALTSLRFFAATAVVLFHAERGALANAPQFVIDLVHNGYQAVPFFFVLSGFILTYVYAGHDGYDGMQATPGVFWGARFARIYPAYALAFLVELPWHVYTTFASRITTVPTFIVGMLTVPTMTQAWISHEVNVSWNPPAWSLCAEALFYLLFPWLLGRVSRTSVARSLGLSCLVLVLMALVWGLGPFRSTGGPLGETSINAWERFPPFHLPPFLLGVALGRVYLYGGCVSDRARSGLSFVGLVGVIGICGFSSMLPGWMRDEVVMAPLFGLVIFGLARNQGWLPGLLSNRWLVLLGDSSYSIYILHMPLLAWWLWLLRQGLAPRDPLVGLTMFVALVITASVATFWWIETPVRRWLVDRLRR